jgi:ribosomal protein S27AE
MPIPHSAVFGAKLLRELRRECPKCGAEVTVKLEQRNVSVDCVNCGASIPPKKSS